MQGMQRRDCLAFVVHKFNKSPDRFQVLQNGFGFLQAKGKEVFSLIVQRKLANVGIFEAGNVLRKLLRLRFGFGSRGCGRAVCLLFQKFLKHFLHLFRRQGRRTCRLTAAFFGFSCGRFFCALQVHSTPPKVFCLAGRHLANQREAKFSKNATSIAISVPKNLAAVF